MTNEIHQYIWNTHVYNHLLIYLVLSFPEAFFTGGFLGMGVAIGD